MDTNAQDKMQYFEKRTDNQPPIQRIHLFSPTLRYKSNKKAHLQAIGQCALYRVPPDWQDRVHTLQHHSITVEWCRVAIYSTG